MNLPNMGPYLQKKINMSFEGQNAYFCDQYYAAIYFGKCR